MVAVFPHCDDFPLFAGGTIAAFAREGWPVYLIRTTNDEKDSYGLTIGETVAANEADFREMGTALEAKEVFDFNYRNHYLDSVPVTELRHRLITLFRHLKADVVITFDPWGHYEENPDHEVTARAVEGACWMAERHLDLPELARMGIEPHPVAHRYYSARGPQLVNRVVDIESTLDAKKRGLEKCRTQVGHMMHLAGFEGTPTRFIETELLGLSRRVGLGHGVKHAEAFHHVGSSA